jgi:hypothetical protein
MKNRLYLACGVLLGTALVWAGWLSGRQPRRTPEPVYDGTALSYWLTNVYSFNSKNMPQYPEGLLNDSNAIPFLLKSLKGDTSFGAVVYRDQVWPRLPIAIQKLLPPPPPVNLMRVPNALFFVTQMGPAAKPATPSLIKALKGDDSPRVRQFAALALGYIGASNSSVTTALTQALKDKDLTVRTSATNALLKLDPEAAAEAGVKKPSP